MKTIVTTFVVGLAFAVAASTASANTKTSQHHTLKLSDTPSAVQKTVNEQASGGKLVRVEKEKRNGKMVYEAIVAKDGKHTGIEISDDGSVVSTHDEKMEHRVSHTTAKKK